MNHIRSLYESAQHHIKQIWHVNPSGTPNIHVRCVHYYGYVQTYWWLIKDIWYTYRFKVHCANLPPPKRPSRVAHDIQNFLNGTPGHIPTNPVHDSEDVYMKRSRETMMNEQINYGYRQAGLGGAFRDTGGTWEQWWEMVDPLQRGPEEPLAPIHPEPDNGDKE
jgi:hypothetical protein